MAMTARSLSTSSNLHPISKYPASSTPERMYRHPFQVRDLFYKIVTTLALVVLLGDAGTPKSFRGKKGKNKIFLWSQ